MLHYRFVLLLILCEKQLGKVHQQFGVHGLHGRQQKRVVQVLCSEEAHTKQQAMLLSDSLDKRTGQSFRREDFVGRGGECRQPPMRHGCAGGPVL